ncbi:MAG: MOSC N-terminal beta barrel domain-containing protein [Actinomycetota bacterium]
MTTGTVSELNLFPIKSCGGVSVDEAQVIATGFEGDRQWQVSSDGKPVTQRQKSILATVRPRPIEGGLRLTAPGRDPLEVARPAEADAETTVLIGVPLPVADAGDEAAAWFAALLDDPGARLHALPADGGLSIPEAIDVFDQPIAFGDLAPVLVANTASLEWLVARAGEPFAMDRFRANAVVATDEPFAEDTWARFRLGEVQIRHGLAWPRCSIPQVDQDTGDRHREPAQVMATHRRVAEAPDLPEAVQPIVIGSAVFGVGCGVGPVGAVVRVGDALAVEETMTPLLAAPVGA